MAQRTIQGSRYDGVNSQNRFSTAIDDYFPCLGNGELFLVPPDFAVSLGNGARDIAKHVVNFAGTLDKLVIRVKGNTWPADYVARIEINGVATDLTVTIPAATDGDFSPDDTSASASFVSGDEIVGHVIDAVPRNGDPGLFQCYLEMTPSDGERTCYKSTGYGAAVENGGVTDPAFATFPLSGSLVHYNSQQTLYEDLGPLTTTQVGNAMEMRAVGAFSYLQACGQIFGDCEFYLDKNGTPLPSEGSKDLALTFEDVGSAYTVTGINTDGSFSNVSGDAVSITAIDRSGGSGFSTIFSVGCNWEGSGSNKIVDLMIGESPTNSFDRDTQFNFIQDLTPGGDFERRWVAGPLGSFEPLPITRKHDVEVTPSFEMRLRHLRAYMDTNPSMTPGDGVRVASLVDGANGDLEVLCTEPGLYVDDSHEDVVAADTPWCFELRGPQAFAISHDPFYAHISWIAVSYGAAGGGGGVEGPRILPDPEPLLPEPCITHRARCWKIARQDGAVYALTEHDRDIVAALVADSPATLTTFKACGAISGSASALSSTLGETGSEELAGALSSVGIKGADLLGGLFDNARVEVWYIPWGSYADTEATYQLSTGYFGSISKGDASFKNELLTLSGQMQRKSFLRIITESCDVQRLGDERCGVDVSAFTATGAVTSLAADDGYALTPKRTFSDATRTEEDGWFDGGRIQFLTGANALQYSDVKSYVSGEFVLWDPLVYDIAEGDTYEVVAGCDRSFATCRDKFNNSINHRGFPDLPGNDAISEFPKPKAN